MWRGITIGMLLLAGCAQLPPTAEDLQSKKFEAAPGKAAIYIVRPRVDSPNDGTILIGNNGMITTRQGTYYRWEATPGARRIQGYGPYNASVTVQAEAGKVYFVQHTVVGDPDDGGVSSMHLQQVNERYGRQLVSIAQLL
jgi:hypothetical protein